jgi:CelD/BcsL family acetyltransferase involved in cellulose biosynthesis
MIAPNLPVGPLTLDVIASVERLQSLEAEWNDLLRSSAADTVFLTWEWVTTWWSIYGTSAGLHVLVARDASGDLVGIAPLKRVAHRIAPFEFDRLEFIGWGGDVTPEYLDFIVRRGYEDIVFPAFLDELMSSPRAALVDLRPLRPESPLAAALDSRRRARGSSIRFQPYAECPLLRLPESLDQFSESQSRNYRKKIGEYQRRCERDLAIRFRMSASLEDIRRDMAALVELHHRRWQGATRAFRTPEYRRFHAQLAECLFVKGHTRLLVLERGSQPIAALYCFSYDGRYSYYQGGWDPAYARYRPGLVMMHRAIQLAITEKAQVFDFLRGSEAYKDRWATERQTSVRATLWSGGGLRVASTLHEVMGRVVRRAQGALGLNHAGPAPSGTREAGLAEHALERMGLRGSEAEPR